MHTGGRPHAVSMAGSEVPSIQQEPPGSITNTTIGGQEELRDKMEHLGVSENGLTTAAASVITQDPPQSIKRQDSDTGEVDEFQDAED